MRLHRPYIPFEIRCIVALRGLGFMWPEEIVKAAPNKSILLKKTLSDLAEILHCEVGELRLDHDPPLALREKRAVGQNMRLEYVPDANDPDHLFYRPHGAQHDGSHDIKTRVRGDHGQFSDLALIRREKRRSKKLKKNPCKWRSQPMRAGKTKWPKRPFPKRKAK